MSQSLISLYYMWDKAFWLRLRFSRHGLMISR